MFISRSKATWLLAICILMVILTYPYRQGLWMGFLHHGMLAAVIGGLADWYAVTALFRRPLGISWRTEIIVRNRERIFDAVQTYVCDDLLNIEHLQQEVKKLPVLQLLMRYLYDSNGKEKMDNLLCLWAEVFIEQLQIQSFATCLGTWLDEMQAELKVQNSISRAVVKLLDGRDKDILLEELVSQIEKILYEPVFMENLESLTAAVKAEYAACLLPRQVILQAFDVSAKDLAGIIQKECLAGLGKLREPSHPLKQQFENNIIFYAKHWVKQQCSDDPAHLADQIESSIRHVLMHLKGKIPVYIPKWTKWYLERLHKEKDLAESLEANIKRLLHAWISQNHYRIRQLVEARLETFSDREFAAFVEKKVKDDLQVIRINGSVVGAIAGMVLHVVTKLAGIG